MKLALLLRYLEESRYSLAQLRAAVEKELSGKGFHVVVRSYNDPFIMLRDGILLRNKGYSVFIGYSLLTTSLPRLIAEIKEVSKTAKTHGIHVVAGGPHATGDPLGTLRLGFQAVFHGESEETLPNYFKHYLEGGDVFKVKGLVTWDNETPIYTGKQERVDIDKYPPFPYWEGIYAPIEITRGCPWGCRYCEVPYMHGAVVKHRSVENVVYYAKIFWQSGRRDLRFITPNAFSYLSDGRKINIPGLCGLLETLYQAGRRFKGRIFMGSFPSEIRPEHASIDEAVTCLRRFVSNKNVIIGAQSGSERVLSLINRGHDVETVVDAVETLNKHGFRADVDFIYALPFEEEEDLYDTLRLMEKLAYSYNARIHAHYFLPLPATPLEVFEPRDPPGWFMRGLFKLLGRGKLYGDWLKQRELSKQIVDLRRRKVIIGLKGWRMIRRI
jgi:B12-binding domain/radical SAM domain protein